MSKHTPGPWKIVKPEDEDANYSQKQCQIVGGLIPICTLAAALGHKEANAHLIAAAPDLLEALRRFVSYGNIFGYGSWERNPYEQALEVIAKAEGDQP